MYCIYFYGQRCANVKVKFNTKRVFFNLIVQYQREYPDNLFCSTFEPRQYEIARKINYRDIRVAMNPINRSVCVHMYTCVFLVHVVQCTSVNLQVKRL